jgi:hypothetical protein
MSITLGYTKASHNLRCSLLVLVEGAEEGSISAYLEEKTLWMRKRYTSKRISSLRL